MPPRPALVVALALGASALTPVHASAQGPQLRWSESWQRVHPASYAATTIGISTSLLVDQLYEQSPDANLRGGWAFDDDVRRSLRAPTHEDRERAAAMSDVLLGVLLAWPVLDSLALAGIARQSPDVAWQLTSVLAEVIAADFVLSTLIKLFAHRERPHGDACTLADRRTNPDRCGTRGRNRSFYSGHASAAFSSAGAVCMSHAFVPLWGDAGADAFACGGALALASIVGVLRVLADRHWASDVIGGSLIGLATGLLLPYLLHYGWDPSDAPPTPVATSPLREAQPLMFSYRGSF